MNIVIMAGGKGTRFWPSSTATKPKQFCPCFLSNRCFKKLMQDL